MRPDRFSITHFIFSKALPFLITGISFFYSLLLLSCKDQTTQNHTSNIVFPDSNVSFSKYVEPLFQETCLGGGCHGGSQPAANLDLETDMWHSLIDYTPQIVLVRNGNNSPLVKYLDGRLAPQMPLRSQPLTTNQINGVKKWSLRGWNAVSWTFLPAGWTILRSLEKMLVWDGTSFTEITALGENRPCSNYKSVPTEK